MEKRTDVEATLRGPGNAFRDATTTLQGAHYLRDLFVELGCEVLPMGDGLLFVQTPARDEFLVSCERMSLKQSRRAIEERRIAKAMKGGRKE